MGEKELYLRNSGPEERVGSSGARLQALHHSVVVVLSAAVST